MTDQQNHSDLTPNYTPSEVEGQSTLRQIHSIRLSPPKYCLFLIGCLLSAGILLLLAYWYPALRRWIYHDDVPLSQATHIAILNYDSQISLCELAEEQVWSDQENCQRELTFTNRYLKYRIDRSSKIAVQIFNIRNRLKRVCELKSGLTEKQIQDLRQCYGKGTMEIQKVKWYQLLIKETFRPLYIFLFFSTALWIYEEYYVYTFIILATCLVAIAISVYQLMALNKKIYEMAYYEAHINTLRNGFVVRVSSLDIVPGDIVFLKEQIKLPFEGIILEGSALINECALTGQSVPVVKKADLPETYQQPKNPLDKSCFLYQGTSIVQVSSKKQMKLFEPYRQAYGIPVCVSRTNFTTMKGQLIRIILFPKQQENIFQKQSGKFLLFLFMVSLLTFLGMIPQLLKTGSPADIIVSFLDLVAITVPAALPVSMAFGVIYSINKLKDKNIFCIEENKVIVGGDVSFCCFDKTGTLTEDFMDFEALVPCLEGQFHETIKNRLNQRASVRESLKVEPYLNTIFSNMAANHSIVKIEDTGELVGDPMEIKLFLFGEFSFNHSNPDPNVLFSFSSDRGNNGSVYRRFEFDSELQRMSVVCSVQQHANEAGWYSFVKGSPQIMATLMIPSSIPSNYSEVLKDYTSNGFRVLAIASKPLETDYRQVTRKEVESGLTFNGFEVFENKLKEQTKLAIAELKNSSIGVVMITGDNALTGANIAYKCNIAHINQGMIICDYQDDRFVQEPFYYTQRDPQEQQNALLILPQEQNHKTPFFNKKEPPPIEIQLTENFKTSKGSPYKDTDESDKQQNYLRKILEKAKYEKCQLCLTGKAFNQLFQGTITQLSDLKKALLNRTTVYARTKPNDKAKIVMAYQHTKKTVAMCGDGANDCGALKQADIGLSLSPAEASISAPFTSQVTNISSMVQLIKQCRAGLATNFSLFNIMASYALTQYVVTTISEIFYAYPAQYQYMYWDLACNFFFIILIGRTGTTSSLSSARPSNSLFCFSNLFQVMFSFILILIGDICMVTSLSGLFSSLIDYPQVGGFQVNLDRYLQDGDRPSNTPETSILFLFANIMYIFTLVAFNIGRPWRKPVYTNPLFMIWLSIALCYSLVIIVVPGSRWSEFQVAYIDQSPLTVFVLGMSLGFGIVILVLQKFVWEPFFIWLKTKYPQKSWL